MRSERFETGGGASLVSQVATYAPSGHRGKPARRLVSATSTVPSACDAYDRWKRGGLPVGLIPPRASGGTGCSPASTADRPSITCAVDETQRSPTLTTDALVSDLPEKEEKAGKAD